MKNSDGYVREMAENFEPTRMCQPSFNPLFLISDQTQFFICIQVLLLLYNDKKSLSRELPDDSCSVGNLMQSTD